MAASQSFHGSGLTISHWRDWPTPPVAASHASIGVFDGVHRGHAVLLQKLVQGAQAAGLPAVVVTFHPHPAVVLGGQTDFSLLTTPEERAALLCAHGVQGVLTLPFTHELAAMRAADFMAQMKAHLGVQHLWIGYDFALGRGREGDFNYLTELGRKLGYTVSRLDAIRQGDEVFSSSAARAALQRGDVEAASRILGRWYSLSGTVVHGDGRGRKINLPTANLQPAPEKLVPAPGVYACYAWLDGERYPAVTNIGRRPTFYDRQVQLSIEAHLLDFRHEIYGRTLRLEFVRRLRDEQRFAGVEALLAQIRADIVAAREVLKKEK